MIAGLPGVMARGETGRRTAGLAVGPVRPARLVPISPPAVACPPAVAWPAGLVLCPVPCRVAVAAWPCPLPPLDLLVPVPWPSLGAQVLNYRAPLHFKY